jgi:hypothetical protein
MVRAGMGETGLSEAVERPWALMRRHAGWADVFEIRAEDAQSVTGAYVDRETVGGTAIYNRRAVLARFATIEDAQAAREAAMATWRAHDDAIRDAEASLRAVEKAREQAWLAVLGEAAR